MTTNEVEPRGRSDGCASINEFEQQQQQDSTGIKLKQQWRRSENRQLLRGQWTQQGGSTRGRQMVNIRKMQNAKTVEEEKEGMLEKQVKYLKTSERTECEVEESAETLELVELAELEVNEEEGEWRTEGGEAQFEEEGDDLDPEQVRQCRE